MTNKKGGKKPRTLYFDVEVAPMSLLTFELLNKNKMIDPAGILTHSYLICASWAWSGQKTVHSVSQLNDRKAFKANPHDDRVVVTKLREVMSQADALVGHYSTGFDSKVMNSRLAFHGMAPIPEMMHLDTCLLAKRKFKFASNSLDYISRYLGGEGKTETNFKLWVRCWKGEAKAVKEMAAYCSNDVRQLAEMYSKIQSFEEAKINYSLYLEKPACKSCGGSNIVWRGWRYRKQTRIRRYSCSDCSAWSYVTAPRAKKDGWPT